jgi:hypothetical protein
MKGLIQPGERRIAAIQPTYRANRPAWPHIHAATNRALQAIHAFDSRGSAEVIDFSAPYFEGLTAICKHRPATTNPKT